MSVEQQLKSDSIIPEYKKVILNIMYTGNWVNETVGEYFKQFDLTAQQFNVLRILRGQKGNPLNLQDIQERMISRMSNTTRLIDKLKLKGLVERVQCEKNRRKIEVTITKKGLNLLLEIDKSLPDHETKTTKNLTLVEAKQLNELLNKLRTKN